MFFFFNDTATTEIYTLSLHDALPICHGRKLRRWQPHSYLLGRALQGRRRRGGGCAFRRGAGGAEPARWTSGRGAAASRGRSEEHTSELQSQSNIVCRLLLEKKKRPET